MRKVYRQLYEILSPRDRRLVLLLFALMFSAAVMETIGVASILPLIAVLANPEVALENVYLRVVYDRLGFESTQAFQVFLGVMFFVLFLAGLLARATAYWAQARFANMRMHVLSSQLFSSYLDSEYEWFLGKHSSALTSGILMEVNRVIHEALFPSLQVIAHGMVIILLMSLLILVDPVLAISVVAVLGSCYLVIYWSMRNWVSRVGKVTFTANRARYRVTQDAFSGIKDLKIKGLEQRFRRRFENASARFARSRVAEQLIGHIPSYGMQGVLFGGMLLVILYLMTAHGELGKALPVLAMYAVAGYRMMPSLQNTYRHLITLRNSEPVLSALHADLKAARDLSLRPKVQDSGQRLTLTSEIRMRKVCYRYPGADHDALREISLEIPRYSTVAFVGPTGCGKTTAVDVILGLLRPRAGTLEVDGQVITEQNVRPWQRNTGYVPQDIFLIDASVAANIAYGFAEHEIDMVAVERAARVANLHAFVETELKNGYATLIGERGVRLSGGQRQRIGIARALYHDPEVLILDEATSALDNVTEHAVMEAVHGLARKKTIIIIAHRLTTVQECDVIFLLTSGQIVARGRYAALLENSPEFQNIERGRAGIDIGNVT